MRTSLWTLLAVTAVTGLLTCVANAQEERGTYERLDQGRLADTLSRLQMHELLDELIGQNVGDSSIESVWVSAQAKIGQANRLADDLQKRRLLLDEAAGMLNKLIERTASATKWEEICNNLTYRFTMIDALGRTQCGLRADALIMLMGGQEDRAMILEYTAKVFLRSKNAEGIETRSPVEEVQYLLEGYLERVRENNVDRVQWEPKLENIQTQLRYSLAWIRLYRGIAATEKNERIRYLSDAMSAAEPFAKGDWEEQVKDPASQMLQGVASMEMGLTYKLDPTSASSAVAEHKRADDLFKMALTMENVERPLQVQINFLIARNLIESGMYEAAVEAVNGYGELVRKILGDDAALQGDVQAALLKNHLYTRWAADTKEVAKAAEYRLKAQTALLDFLSSHKDQEAISQAFYKIIANKYRDQDPKTLSPIMQYAIGMDEFSSAAPAEGKEPNKPGLEKSETLLELVVANTSPEAQGLQQEANKTLGLVKYYLGKGRDAAKKSVDSATFDGVFNGCKMYRTLLDAGTDPDIVTLRKDFILALQKLLGNAEWAAKPEVAPWFADLGEQFAMLAKANPVIDKETVNLLSDAIKAYRQVPQADKKQFMDTQHVALNLEFEKLSAMKTIGTDANELNAAADDFTRRLREYSKQAQALIKEIKDDQAFLQFVTDWGADATFTCAIVMYEQLGLKSEALTLIRELPENWKAAETVLLQANVFEIRKLTEEKNTREAVEKINQLRKNHPEQASGLMRLVIEQLRLQIEKLREDPTPGSQERLKSSRAIYLDFATDLRRSVQGQSEEERMPFDQMYGDALVENDRLQEALVEFEKISAFQNSRREAKEKEFDVYVDKWVAQMEKIKGNPTDLIRMGEEFPILLQKNQIDPAQRGYAQALKIAVSYSKQTSSSKEDFEFRAKQVATKLNDAFTGLRKDLKRSITRDFVTLYGMARCYQAQKDYDKAIKIYIELVDGLDPVNSRLQYGRMQLELIQSIFDAALANTDKAKRTSMLENLLLRIKRFREMDNQLWGRYGEMNQVEAQIKQALGGG